MSKVFDIAIRTCEGIQNGTIPLCAAHETHLTLHRAVWDRVQDNREACRLGEKLRLKELDEAKERLLKDKNR